MDSLIFENQFNIGYICSTLQCIKGKGEKIALKIISSDKESKSFTYNDIEKYSNKIANGISSLGYKEGDVIFTFLGRSFEQTVATLALLKQKIITGTLFTNFGESAIVDRLKDADCKCVITQKKYVNKILNVKEQLPKLQNIILIDIDKHKDSFILSLHELLENASEFYETQLTPAETPSMLHYTSGSTGKPKGVLHVHKSVVLQNFTTKNILCLNEDDIFWCTADPGWVTGISYGVIGPMSLGITQIYFEGGYNPEEWIEIIQKENVTIWYTAPTALRMLMQEDESIYIDKIFPNLKYIFCVGEPLNPEVYLWTKKIFKKEVYDTFFQTETGSIMISNFPSLKIKPGSMGKPIEKIKAVILDDDGNQIPLKEQGNLCIRSGWDSMFIKYLNNEETYNKKFKNGFYFTGDKASVDEDGYFWFSGRSDDIINTGGHLVSPFEVESALLEIPEIVDAAVISTSDDILFEKIIAYIRLANNIEYDKGIDLKIKLHISKKVSPIATPKEVLAINKIPKNKSGKIMRRYLKSIYEGKDPGDISTLDE